MKNITPEGIKARIAEIDATRKRWAPRHPPEVWVELGIKIAMDAIADIEVAVKTHKPTEDEPND